MRRRNQKNNTQVDSEEESESEAESQDTDSTDESVSIANKRRNAASKRKRGRPPGTTKNKIRRRLPNDSGDDASPQPSTSYNANEGSNAQESSESDSGSESPDSDYGPVNDRSPVKRKTALRKRGRPSTKAAAGVASKQKRHHNSINGVNTSKAARSSNRQNTSRKNAKLSTSSDAIFDSKLVEALSQKLVYFLLIEDQKKYAIKRKAIVMHVFKNEDYSPKLYLAVIKKANTILKKTYGMELMELENQKDSYLIVNILRRELGIHDFVELPRLKQQQHGLILYLLTVIYMNDNAITEDELTKSLKPLGIDLTSKRLHPVFGDVKKYITYELVKQMYLNYECISKEPLNYEFTWGLRAKQEFDKRDLLRFVCQIMGDMRPEDWRIQYKDAENSSKPNDS